MFDPGSQVHNEAARRYHNRRTDSNPKEHIESMDPPEHKVTGGFRGVFILCLVGLSSREATGYERLPYRHRQAQVFL